MSKSLEKIVVRAVIRAQDFNSKGEPANKEVILTLRPGWSKIGAYEPTLPGGKLEKTDFNDQLPENYPDEEAIIAACLNAIIRELYEELGITIAPALLQFVTQTTNDAGWITYLFAADLNEKPTLQVKPDSAGTLWFSQLALEQKRYELFADHGFLLFEALKILK